MSRRLNLFTCVKHFEQNSVVSTKTSTRMERVVRHPTLTWKSVTYLSAPRAYLCFCRIFERSLDTCVQTTASHSWAHNCYRFNGKWYSSWRWLTSPAAWIAFCRCPPFCLNFIYPWKTKLLGFFRQVSYLSGMSLDLSASQSSMYLSYQCSCEGERCYNSSLTYGQQKQSRREFVLEEEIDSPSPRL